MSNEKVLSADQEVAVNKIKAFLADESESVFTLTGVGGAGKTFSLLRAIEDYTGVIYGATISHSAKVVLEESLGGKVSCVTIAQLLGLQRRITKDRKVIFSPPTNLSPDRRLPIQEGDLFLIDECSMINDEQYHFIMETKSSKAKIIFVGDSFQLPPIKDDAGADELSSDSLTFNHTQASLTQSMRYSGPIEDLGNLFREEQEKFSAGELCSKHVINHWFDGQDRVSKVNEDGSGYIFLQSPIAAMEIAVNEFKNSSDDIDAFRMIAFKNDTIDTLNQITRNTLFDYDGQEDLQQFEAGELVIANGSYGSSGEIYNNQTFRIKSFTECIGPSDVPCLALALDPDPGMTTNIFVIDTKKGLGAYYAKLNKLEAEADRHRYKNKAVLAFKEQFAHFSYSYALNSHKSQGRTFKDVMVFEHEILNIKRTSLKAKLQAMYVACTRAKRRVFIVNKAYRVDQSGLPDSLRKQLNI